MRAAAGAVLAVLIAVGAPACRPSGEAVDLLIRGGSLVDGTGSPARSADVAVRDGRIVAVGDLDDLAARRTLDASRLIVAPGFIDLHAHSDLVLLAGRETQERLLAARIAQGVTTQIVGNCGLGTAPATEDAAAILASVNGWMTPEGVSADPASLEAYLERLELGGVALNVGTLVPHGPLRISAMGLAAGTPSPEALG
jgi:N-acyl-D-aspartate/D-glutamate deacylase